MELSEDGVSFIWRNPWVGTLFSGYYAKDLETGRFVTVLTPMTEEEAMQSCDPLAPWASPYQIPHADEIGSPQQVGMVAFTDPTTVTDWVVRTFLNPETNRVWSVLINND